MTLRRVSFFIILLVSTPALSDWVVGQAKVDVTGPVFGSATLGYAVPTPIGSGLQQKLYARAFLFEDDEANRVFLIHVDICFVTMALKERVVKNLQSLLPGVGINHANVMIMASHTHSGSSGFSNHFYYNAPSKGMVIENFSALQKGITESALKAYSNREQTDVTWQRSKLFGGAKNRSILPFLQNPEKERLAIGQDTDPTFDQLQFYGPDEKIKGVFNWFAVHATSIKKSNSLISGDNKGYAQYRLEQELGLDNPGFIAAFANANGGDASPNIAGDLDGNGSWECAANENKACAEELGFMQAKKANELTQRRGEKLAGKIHVRHQFVNMSGVLVDGVSTCPAAVGVSMLAGTIEDGQGVGKEGVNCSTGTGPVVQRGCEPRFACHGEKPVVMESGNIGWHPNILPVQLVKIGQIAIVAVPAEFTTVAGYRLRTQLEASLSRYGVKAVIFAGYANGYSSYVATEEEYALQHYEGASTLFGPKTLKAYQKIFADISRDFTRPNPEETQRPELSSPNRVVGANLISAPRRMQRRFGLIASDVGVSLAKRGSAVQFKAYANNPNFSVLARRKIMLVEFFTSSGWKTYLDGADWNTSLSYKRGRATIKWDIPMNAHSGVYRLAYIGCLQSGCSKEFKTSSSSFSIP